MQRIYSLTKGFQTMTPKISKIIMIFNVEIGQFPQTKLVPLFAHGFTVCFKILFGVNNCPKIFLGLHTFHCLTLYGYNLICVGKFSKINYHVFGFMCLKYV